MGDLEATSMHSATHCISWQLIVDNDRSQQHPDLCVAKESQCLSLREDFKGKKLVPMGAH